MGYIEFSFVRTRYSIINEHQLQIRSRIQNENQVAGIFPWCHQQVKPPHDLNPSLKKKQGSQIMLAASTASGARWMNKFWRQGEEGRGERDIDVNIFSFLQEGAREEWPERIYIGASGPRRRLSSSGLFNLICCYNKES